MIIEFKYHLGLHMVHYNINQRAIYLFLSDFDAENNTIFPSNSLSCIPLSIMIIMVTVQNCDISHIGVRVVVMW